MKVRVGPHEYRVRRVRGGIELAGEPCLGLCDHDAQELLVDATLPPSQQVQVLAHEVMEAWVYHFGWPGQDKEAGCDLFGQAVTQLMIDLGHAPAQVLSRIEPEQVTPPRGEGVYAVRMTEWTDANWRLRLFEPIDDSQP